MAGLQNQSAHTSYSGSLQQSQKVSKSHSRRGILQTVHFVAKKKFGFLHQLATEALHFFAPAVLAACDIEILRLHTLRRLSSELAKKAEWKDEKSGMGRAAEKCISASPI